ncbi:class I SAM-dependent methyltransferase [Mycobacterium lehmannii]|uniref:class I SAM-dependent methyltransferase n=1 Tax=Mycobacterium lehmannii TaxID=2048550 RepID=UPI0009E9D79B|nr:methyltransferase domain-containing protein [Mycobacterium lehmannii]
MGFNQVKQIAKRLLDKSPRAVKDSGKKIFRGLVSPYARVRLSVGVQPLSFWWGRDRGQEIARYYLEELFLPEFSEDIRGNCLEFSANDYTSRFGEDSRITKIDILNLEAGNPHTTIQADLTTANDIPSDQFDCIICTHVLHVIPGFEKAIAELHRILRPGGVVLIAVPQVSMCCPEYGELFRFTQEGLRFALAGAFEDENIVTRAYGNSLTAAGEIRGLAAHEFTRRQLNHHDPRFAVEVCARAVKR